MVDHVEASSTKPSPELRITQIRKRDGRIVPFDKEKITYAIYRAIVATSGRDRALAESLSARVVEILNDKYGTQAIPAVEDVQDIVERVLVENGQAKVAKTYIIYRQKRAEMRHEKQRVLEKEAIDEVDKAFDLNALRVLKARYLKKDETGKLIETPKQLFTRISVHAALPDLFYDDEIFDIEKKQQIRESESFDPVQFHERVGIGKFTLNRYHLEALKRMYDRFSSDGAMKVSWSRLLDMLKAGYFNKYEKSITAFYELMVSRKFMPNTPAIANFGNVLGMGSACFVLDVDDSIESIMETLKQTAVVFKAGGGMGYNFSKLRPEGDYVSSTSGVASGPISFMMLFDTMTDVIKQGGIRRGANMGIVNSNHPDVEKFITAKKGNKALRNFNISVLLMPDFWDCYRNNKPYPLVNPRTKKVVREVNPRLLFDMIVYQAWESAEPGVIFFDHVNEHNPFYKHLGPIVTTNPCVSSDSLISTARGLERIDSMTAEDVSTDLRAAQVDRMSSGQVTVQMGVRLQKTSQVIRTGCKPAYRIITGSGYELTATADHRVLTENGWRAVSELSVGVRVCIQSGEGRFNQDRELPIRVVNSITTKKGRKYVWHLPHEWSRELGLCLGWLVGDGWLNTKHNQSGWVFAEEDREARTLLEPILESFVGRPLTEVRVARSVIQLRTASKYVVKFLADLGVKPVGTDKAAPRSLFTATEEAVVGFLKGLFSSDGTIYSQQESRYTIRLNSSSLTLLKDVQLLLLNLGIYSNIYDRSTEPKPFHYTTAKGDLKTYSTSGINYELSINGQNLVKFIKKIGFIKSRHRAIAQEILSAYTRGPYSEDFVAPIESIEYVGEKEVWDITESITHSFIANGLVVHNCGEVLLYPNESCNLGSINVWAFARRDENGKVTYDWDNLREAIYLASRFLDNVIDVNNFPLKSIEDMTLATRKIGLGVMGLADLLLEMRSPYNSDEGRKFMEELMEFINYHSKLASIEMAKERGPVPYFDKSFYPEGRLPFAGFYDRKSWHFDWDKVAEMIKRHGVRNGYTTVIAPTGSISMIAGCSSGIEPIYSLVYEKHVKVGSFYYIDPVFERVMTEEGLFGEDLLRDVNDHGGSIQKISYIPEDLKRVYITAMDIRPEDHIRALAAFQRWTDSSISKTNNFPANATVEDMRESYLLAYKLGCKDVTVFRDTSIKGQVLVAPRKKQEPNTEHNSTTNDQAARAPQLLTMPLVGGSGVSEQVKLCPQCTTQVVYQEGCYICPECGWGACA